MDLIFDEKNLLPLGIFDATLEDVQEHFGGFQKSDRRMKLYRHLEDYVKALRKTDWPWILLIDGSFVMKCVDEPEDIDLVLVMPKDWNLAADLPPYLYNLVSKRRVQQEFGMDVFVTVAGSAVEKKWLEFFQQVNIKWCEQFNWPGNSKKGLVRVRP